MPSSRKFILAVKTWGSDEAIHSWKYLKAHILQNSKDGGMWSDELVVVHISKGKTKEKEPWDQGGAVIAGMKTALQPYKHDVFDLEGDPGPLLVDIANKEQADILVLATRGRNAMKKAMLGSMTDFVMQRANCACLVVKPQIGAGDTYRMKSAANPQGAGVASALHTTAAPRAQSPASSPMFGRITTLHGSTPFNRRVAIAYDTTASGRYLLKWASDTILEPTDNVFVVRAVPKLQMRKPGTSFADKNNVQRLAGDALQGMQHVTTFNLQQGNARKSVLAFASKESVDLLIIGMYRPNTRRKGLAVRGNAVIVANRCACPCLVVPMTEAALQSCVKATDLELAAAEEEELASGSESDSDDDEPNPGTPTAAAAAGGLFGSGAPAADGAEEERDGGALTPDHHGGSPEPGGGLASFRGNSAAAIKQIRAPIEAFFKRRGSMSTSAAGGPSGSSADGGGDRRAALLAALQGGSSSSTAGGSSLQPGRYIVEVDSSGAVKSVKPSEKHHHHASPLAPAAAAAAPSAAEGGLPAAGVSSSEAAAAASAASPLRLTDPGFGSEQAPDMVDGADLTGTAAAPPATAAAAAAPDSSSAQDVQQLRQLLAEREAELVALRQQLQQLAPPA